MALDILLVEPESELRDRVLRALRRAGHSVWAFAGAAAASDSLGDAEPELALLTSAGDPAMDDLVDGLRDLERACQVVWIAPEGGETEALTRRHHPRGLVTRAELEDQAVGLAGRIEKRAAQVLRTAPPMMGKSAAMDKIRTLLDRIAQGGAPTVLITGESGTGKEVAARRIHALGPRSGGPLVEVDCAAIPAELMEGTLLGHEPGAFTDARETRIGLLELAQGGTVFLDEIGELELGLQAKLLRVLDTRRFRRLGGQDEIQLDVQLVAATNRDLQREVRDGGFRADLFYRLDVVRVQLPALRERGDDVLLLARRFLEEAARRLGKDLRGFSPDAAEALTRHPWPGNIRELRNHMERLALMAEPEARRVENVDLEAPETGAHRVSIDLSRGPLPWEEIEHAALTEALRVAGGNVSEAARLLGLGRGAFRYRLSRHGMDTLAELPQDSKEAA